MGRERGNEHTQGLFASLRVELAGQTRGCLWHTLEWKSKLESRSLWKDRKTITKSSLTYLISCFFWGGTSIGLRCLILGEDETLDKKRNRLGKQSFCLIFLIGSFLGWGFSLQQKINGDNRMGENGNNIVNGWLELLHGVASIMKPMY